jgi:serine/threonine-protein kinase
VNAGEIVAGKYRIEGVIFAGRTTQILGAVDVASGRPLAIKVLAPGETEHPDSLERFRRETEVAARLRCPNVPAVVEIGSLPDGSPLIVQERLTGETLADLLKRSGPLDRKSTRLNSSHNPASRMPSSA